MESQIYDLKDLVELVMQVNELMEALGVLMSSENVLRSMRLIIELLWVFWAKIRSLKGETNVYGLYWDFSFHCGEKRRCVCNLGAYLWVIFKLWTLQR